MNNLLKILEKAEHEFNFLNGLYASDNKRNKENFRLNYKNLIKELGDEIKKIKKNQ
ncbi:MAG: hypothetical protein KO202_05855 [Methanobacteriaceae archaeon]|nr:hypothetical protein [Methanobacteriaceae archaeon]